MSEVDTTSASTLHASPDPPKAAEAKARETSPAPQAATPSTEPSPVVSKSAPDSTGAATPSKPTELALSSPGSSPGVPAFLPFPKGGDFKVAARTWADAAIVQLGASTDDAEREAIRQEAIRVAALALAHGSEHAEKLAQEIIMRVNRAMGLANPRRSAGRPKRDEENSEPVSDRGSTNLPGQLPGDPADGRAAEAGANNRPTGRTISAPSSGGDETSGEKTLPGGRELSRSTKADYRQDAEALSDEGFERVAQAVRDTPGAGPMNRRLVRTAGRVERAGGDPASVVGVPLPPPKAKKRSRAKGLDARPEDEARRGIAADNAAPGDEARRNIEAHVEAYTRRIAPEDLHCVPLHDLSKSIAAGSVDAVVTTLSDRAAAVAVRDLAAHALRPGGLLVALVVPERLCDVMPSIAGGDLGYRWTSAVLTREPRDVPAAHVGGSRCVFAVVCTRVGADPKSVVEVESPRPLPELLAAWVTAPGVVCDPCCRGGRILSAALGRGFRCIGAVADTKELERLRQSLGVSPSGETPGLSPSTVSPAASPKAADDDDVETAPRGKRGPETVEAGS